MITNPFPSGSQPQTIGWSIARKIPRESHSRKARSCLEPGPQRDEKGIEIGGGTASFWLCLALHTHPCRDQQKVSVKQCLSLFTCPHPPGSWQRKMKAGQGLHEQSQFKGISALMGFVETYPEGDQLFFPSLILVLVNMTELFHFFF